VLRVVDVRTAAADELPKAAAAFADAFVDDPVFRFLRPAGLRPEVRLRTMFVVELKLYVLRNGGTVWTTSGHDRAVAVLPPDAWELPKSMTGREALGWLRAFRTGLPRASKVQRAMEQRHPREPHFYIRTVGVRTALQEQVEASSERSAALYERPGFRHLGAIELAGGGPLVWPMLRPAAAS
jgi:hypothetical protein